MAEMIPRRPDEGTPASEVAVFDRLRALDDEWRVFHSVAWQGERNRRQGDGEADFVLLHPSHGLVVLEVKGGEEIGVHNGEWYSIPHHDNRRRRIKNPFLQAKDSKYALVDRITRLEIPNHLIPVTHGVVFPGAVFNETIGMYGHREITCDRSGMRDIRAFVSGLVNHWGQTTSLTRSHMSTLTNVLAPTVSAKVSLRGVVEETLDQILELTNQQRSAMAMLRRQRQLVVRGAAGTGKTVLAVERARRLSEDGFSVLLTCFNEPLSGYLADQVVDTPAITVRTFHGFCRDAVSALERVMPDSPDDDWWEEGAPELLIEAAESGLVGFDAVVVDEAQDFAPNWFLALRIATGDLEDAPFYVFGDSRQEIYRDGWLPPGEWPEVALDTNCRSSLNIAKRVNAVFGEPVSAMGAEGPPTKFIEVESRPEALATIQDVVAGLLERDFKPSQVVILARDPQNARKLRSRLAGNTPIVPLGQRGVVAESIQRFKGLEADVVVVDLTGEGEEPLPKQAYVGLSRARGVLIAIGTADAKGSINWT